MHSGVTHERCADFRHGKKKRQKRGEFITPPRPTGRRSKKVRDYGVEKLQDGGLTDQKFRGYIVRELDDIKFKLDANSRKDLHTSISCLKQGVQRLHMSLDQCVESGNPSTSELPEDGKQSQAITNAWAISNQTKPAQKEVTVEDAIALARAVSELKIKSSERFESAKKSFEEAGKKAAEAFHNEALSPEKRVLASKVRIASGILEHLEDLEFAVGDCLLYLQELHDMPAIKNMFSVHIKGGIKSVFKKDSRLEIVETVTMMNVILADFISKFTKRKMAVFDWPLIECGTQMVHPIPYQKPSGITLPWVLNTLVVKEKFINLDAIIMNSKGNLIGLCKDRPGPQILDKTTGKLQPYLLYPLEDNARLPERIHKYNALAVDEDDTVYFLSGDEDGNHCMEAVLSVYSADRRNTHRCRMNFSERSFDERYYQIKIAATKDKHIVICCQKKTLSLLRLDTVANNI